MLQSDLVKKFLALVFHAKAAKPFATMMSVLIVLHGPLPTIAYILLVYVQSFRVLSDISR